MQSKSQYELFREGLEKIGQVRRAWFTTFNLDVHFFERFIFPLLTGKDFTQMHTPEDYESLSQSLDYSGEPADGLLELHLFYDFRKLEGEKRAKLTTVQIHPVNVSAFSGAMENSFSGGIFHPKVALFENKEGALWLMAGSGNLTLSGWSRNSECLAFEPIVSIKTARPLGQFFEVLFGHIQNKKSGDNPLLKRLREDKGFGSKHKTKASADWTFLSSMGEGNLLDQLFTRRNNARDLFVWSPYFDVRLDELLNHIPGSAGKIHLIPAPNRDGRLGITKEAFEKLKGRENLHLMEDNSRTSEQFTHAKIWLCGNQLAIGSWNCTGAGLNLESRCNVEAGIIYTLPDHQAEELGQFCRELKPLQNPSLPSETELKEELNDLLDDYSFALPLILDWKELKIRIEGSISIAARKKVFKSGTVLILPGMGKCDPSGLPKGLDVRKASAYLLKDRMYAFQSAEGKVLYRGYLLESGLENRPVQGFRDLDDFLSGWIMGRPEDQRFRHSLNYQSDSGSADDFSEEINTIFSTGLRNTWFAAFLAFDKMTFRIIQVKKSVKRKAERELEYIRIGRVIPGNLSELRKHLQFVLEAYLSKEKDFRITKVYLWFLIEKANAVFKLFNDESKLNNEMLDAIDQGKLDSELLKINSGNSKGVKKWKAFIKSELNNWEWNG